MSSIPKINFNDPNARQQIIEFYIKCFNELPSGTHMIYCYTQIEKFVLQKFSDSSIMPDENLLRKFDSCKRLALNASNLHERKQAFFTSLKVIERILEIKLNYERE